MKMPLADLPLLSGTFESSVPNYKNSLTAGVWAQQREHHCPAAEAQRASGFKE